MAQERFTGELPRDGERFFKELLEHSVEVMVAKAKELGLPWGVAAAAYWKKGEAPVVVYGIHNRLDRDIDPTKPGDIGTNYMGMLGGKLSYMMSTFTDSGSGVRPLKNAESWYKGGLCRLDVLDTYVFTVYSGAPDELIDVEVAKAGLRDMGIDPDPPRVLTETLR